jgi:hypothetical protein
MAFQTKDKMVDSPESLILAQLRAIRTDLGSAETQRFERPVRYTATCREPKS